jgi:hypothetical protein
MRKIIAAGVHRIHIEPTKSRSIQSKLVSGVLSARKNVLPVFFNETINCERYMRVEGQHFQHYL